MAKPSTWLCKHRCPPCPNIVLFQNQPQSITNKLTSHKPFSHTFHLITWFRCLVCSENRVPPNPIVDKIMFPIEGPTLGLLPNFKTHPNIASGWYVYIYIYIAITNYIHYIYIYISQRHTGYFKQHGYIDPYKGDAPKVFRWSKKNTSNCSCLSPPCTCTNQMFGGDIHPKFGGQISLS